MFRILVLTTVLATCIGGAAFQKHRRPSRFLIPKDYVGWVRINFKVSGAPALPIEDGFYLFRLASDGTLKTSSNIQYGAARDDYYYYSDTNREQLKVTTWGNGGIIWGQFNGSGYGSRNERLETYQYFFVGTELQFKKCAYSAKAYDGRPNVGPLDAGTLATCTAK